jgi:hypothetical protein
MCGRKTSRSGPVALLAVSLAPKDDRVAPPLQVEDAMAGGVGLAFGRGQDRGEGGVSGLGRDGGLGGGGSSPKRFPEMSPEAVSQT